MLRIRKLQVRAAYLAVAFNRYAGVGGLSLTVRALGSCYSGRPIGAPGGATPAADGHRVQELEWVSRVFVPAAT